MNVAKFQGTISGDGYGYVYLMSYPNSDKVKIGHSLNPTTRATEIGGTLAPETPIPECYFWCSERREDVERRAHEIERDNRYNGEWFTITVERAMQAIRQAAQSVGVDIRLVYDRNEWEIKAAAKLKQQEWARKQEALRLDAEETSRLQEEQTLRRLQQYRKRIQQEEEDREYSLVSKARAERWLTEKRKETKRVKFISFIVAAIVISFIAVMSITSFINGDLN